MVCPGSDHREVGLNRVHGRNTMVEFSLETLNNADPKGYILVSKK